MSISRAKSLKMVTKHEFQACFELTVALFTVCHNLVMSWRTKHFQDIAMRNTLASVSQVILLAM